MSALFAAVVLGTPHPMGSATFYRALLGWDVVDEAPDWVRLRDPQRERSGLSFQLEADFRAPVWPGGDGPPMHMHLDVFVDDLDAEVARAVGLGASAESYQPQDGVRVMRDPYGQLFCLFVDGA